ncbi:MAG: carboxylating nicotinate-nucleotide diphosphorylase [Pseudomonadota bacterium]
MKILYNMQHEIDRLIEIALDEDIGAGDVTSDAVVDLDAMGEAKIIAKQNFILVGIEVAQKVFARLDPEVISHASYKDGGRIAKGETILLLRGRLRHLLAGERTALNFMQRLSGIATLTQQYADKIAGTGVILLDTRKTTPGWRLLEKYAVKLGGGNNHRFGLYDGILIKDNHIAAAGGIVGAVERVRKTWGYRFKIEVEVTNEHEIAEALACKVDIIMLDNMDIDQIKNSVSIINRQALVEVSGGVSLENISDIAKTGVDMISVGALTHSAQAADISMLIFN